MKACDGPGTIFDRDQAWQSATLTEPNRMLSLLQSEGADSLFAYTAMPKIPMSIGYMCADQFISLDVFSGQRMDTFSATQLKTTYSNTC
jgi:hypothetical protein